MDAAKLVNGAILGYDGEPVEVNGAIYIINPPTIAKIAGASYWLSGFGNVSSIGEIFSSLKDMDNASKALSWFIEGNDSLAKEFSKGSMEEVTSALEKAYSLISAENFIKLSTLARNVARLTANPRP